MVPQKFPTSFNDLPFVERVDAMQQGYEQWESEFDSSGKCIKGCAYHGITIESELEDMLEKTEQVVAELQECVHYLTVQEVQGKPLGWPVVKEGNITSRFGRRLHPVTGNWHNHGGVDIWVGRGTKVFSTADGTVARIWRDSTCGNGLRIKHLDGYETVFCHLDKVVVASGANVSKGQHIAFSGNTGRSKGPHLHYAIKKDGVFIDPEPLMKK